MHPIHDVDAPLMLALALASKRRPASLAEIVAAFELTTNAILSEFKLSDAFFRLSKEGLISAAEGGFTLTPAAEKVMEGGSKKEDKAGKAQRVKDSLAAHNVEGEHVALVVTAGHVAEAMALLAPRRRVNEDYAKKDKRAAQWRQAAAARRRKS